MLFCITTNGYVREGIFDAQYKYASEILNGTIKNPRFLPFIYELDNPEEWTDENAWIKANPGLGTIKSAEVLADKVKAAQLDSLKVKNLVCKDFNVRETGATAYMTYEEILNTQIFDVNAMRPRYAIGGADLSETTDLTAAVLLFRMPDDAKLYIRCMFWMPEDLLEISSQQLRWLTEGLSISQPGAVQKVHPVHSF